MCLPMCACVCVRACECVRVDLRLCRRVSLAAPVVWQQLGVWRRRLRGLNRVFVCELEPDACLLGFAERFGGKKKVGEEVGVGVDARWRPAETAGLENRGCLCVPPLLPAGGRGTYLLSPLRSARLASFFPACSSFSFLSSRAHRGSFARLLQP